MEYKNRAFLPPGLSPMVRGYLECAEWCGLDEQGHEALDLAVHPAWDSEALLKARQDCEELLKLARGEWEGAMSEEQLGHDFYLTRNRHGAGFWDRGLGELGEMLTVLSHGFSEAAVEFDEGSEKLSLV